MKKTVCMFVIGLCLAGMADNRSWTGGGSDANWSTPANWGGTAPVRSMLTAPISAEAA
jgi:hypothetical protein